MPKVAFDITEYQLFHGRCACCHAVSEGALPDDAPTGQMGPRLASFVAVMHGQYHLSLRKLQSLLRDQYQTTFSIGALSEIQGRVSNCLTPIHQAIKAHIQQSGCINADETVHQRNGESGTRWIWLMACHDAAFQQIRYFRNQDAAKHLLGEVPHAIVVTDQCGSYNWLAPERHQFCLAHVKRNLQQMADYPGAGLTAHIGNRLVLLFNAVFRTQHRFENGLLPEALWRRRQMRLRSSIQCWLQKGSEVRISRYAGRCSHLLKCEQGLWVFMSPPGTPLTNNEAERCLRGSVILRKMSYGTNSDRGESYRSRVLSVVETCKKRSLNAWDVVTEIVSAVFTCQPYPDVFNFNSS